MSGVKHFPERGIGDGRTGLPGAFSVAAGTVHVYRKNKHVIV